MCKVVCLRRAVIVLVLAFGLPGPAAQGQASPSAQVDSRPPLPEMWTTLQAKLDSDKVKPGDAVRAQVSQGWVYGTCGVQGGSTLEGTVVAVSALDGATKTSEISVSFAAACGDGTKRRMILIAVYYPLENGNGQMDLYNSMPAGLGPGATGRQNINLNSLPSPDSGTFVQLPLAKIGEVKGLKHLSLAVAKGAKGSSVLSSTDKRLRLVPGTRLVLVPVPEGH